jgi:L-iditol 2-dehydrogenase
MDNILVKSAKIISTGLVDIIESHDNQLKLASDGDILVKMKACGICGSDLEKVYGKYGMTSARLGHEPSGEVLAVGKKVEGFSIGDRVFVHHHVSCNSCHYCSHGNNTMCEYYQKSNIDPCGLADKFIVPSWNVSHGGVLKLPDNVSFEQASLIEPLACCIRALNKIQFQKGDDFIIFGGGPAGLMLINLIRIYEAGKIFILDINDFRLKFCKKFNPDVIIIDPKTQDISQIIKENTNNRGVDIAIVATSSLKALSNAFEVLRKGGQILMFGVPPKDSQFPLDISKLYTNEFSLVPSYAASELETNQALKILSEKRINLDFLITHKFKLEYSSEAFFCAHEAKDCMKVIIITSDQ